jgi:hypothetical protein
MNSPLHLSLEVLAERAIQDQNSKRLLANIVRTAPNMLLWAVNNDLKGTIVLSEGGALEHVLQLPPDALVGTTMREHFPHNHKYWEARELFERNKHLPSDGQVLFHWGLGYTPELDMTWMSSYYPWTSRMNQEQFIGIVVISHAFPGRLQGAEVLRTETIRTLQEG